MFGRIASLLGYERKDTPAGIAVSDPALLALLGPTGSPTAAGILVGPESALRNSVAFASMKIIAETLAQITPLLYRRNGPDDHERVAQHPLVPLITKAANSWTPASEFRLVLGFHYAALGNAYAFVNRDGSGRIVELIPLDSRFVSVVQDITTLQPVYRLTIGDQNREFGRDEILHIRGPGLYTYRGESPVQLAREAIGLSMTLESHCASLFGRGAKPSGILKLKKKATDEILKKLRVSFGNIYGGPGGERTAILEEDQDFQQIQLSSVDSQTLEMRRFQVEEISRFWRIPLHMLNELDRATHNNAESMGQQFLTFCLLPILKLWQDAMAISLLSPEERDAGYYFEFLVDDIAKADIAARFTAYSQAINAGVFNPNEVRAIEGRAPYAGGEIFTRPVNTAAVANAGGAANA
ncbi:MAG: phage portal protein [Azospirillum sp.]|nr:phage portal protein [Azospirillum sp.]